MNYKILLIDPESSVTEFFHSILPAHLYTIKSVSNQSALEKKVHKWQPDLIIVGNASDNSLELLTSLSTNPATASIFLVMLAEQACREKEAEAFDKGADAFWIKPLPKQATLKRTEALLKRKTRLTSLEELQIGEILISKDAFTVKRSTQIIDLTQMEVSILWFLATHPNQVFSRQEIATYLSSDKTTTDNRSIDVHILSLRQKIGAEYIVTRRKRGYLFKL
ncbi:response regulator transcription factor [Cytophagaceae bacterium DM2B3-1]|uniref:Response regulator transcription factor n=1 Tax=Xanthocytophaga flava TaxID=3048013 RepID=A0ABT7CHD4_9BACT|nr:response regulator transcription factor [Xanthocytophaga flavus]MDJ1493144.1 response regulator transcription factor [Xanthocytophaga flavus]